MFPAAQKDLQSFSQYLQVNSSPLLACLRSWLRMGGRRVVSAAPTTAAPPADARGRQVGHDVSTERAF